MPATFAAASDMDAPYEVELKLELPPASLHRVERSRVVRAGKRAPVREDDVTSVYFDTGKFKLRKHGILLRVRRVGRRRLQTVKQDAFALARREWEREIGGDEPDLAAADGTALEPLLTRKLRRALRPVFETQVRRKVIPLHRRGSEIELSIDHGRLRSNGRTVPIAEVELELKRGDTADLFALARGLAKDLPAHPSLLSKGERGYALARGKAGAPVKAVAVALAPGMTTTVAFRAIGYACLRQLLGNQAAVHARQPEGVHQARVALRRLRAAISIFSALLEGPQTQRIKTALKWLAGELAPARDLDVLVAGSIAPLREEKPSRRGVRTLEGDLERRRAAAFDRARTAIESARYRTLLLDAIEWLEAGAWTRSANKAGAALRQQPIEDFAAGELARRHRKIARKGKKIARLDARRRHKLRIAVKKLRYAGEFFSTLFATRKGRKRLRAFLDALERTQDCLGDLNDIRVHEDMVSEVIERPPADGARKARRRAFAAGLVSGREQARAARLLRSAVKAGAVLKRVKPFWT